MIDSGHKLFGFPVHICEQGETPGGDKNLPPVRGAMAFRITGIELLPPVPIKTTAQMLDDGDEHGRKLLKAKSLQRLESRWRKKRDA